MGRARGRYVIFLDSDDLFHPDLLLDMASVLEATGADICICEADGFFGLDTVCFEDESRVRPYTRIKNFKEGLYPRHAFGRNTFQVGGSTPWNKMYRREFLMNSGALFQNTKCCNDCFFVAKAMWEANSVYLLKKTLLLHRKGLGASLQDRRREHPHDTVRVAEKIFDEMDDQSAFSRSEAASLRLKCVNLLMMATRDFINTGTYSENVHDLLAADLRRWGLPTKAHSKYEIKMMLHAALITHGSWDKVIWAHDRWKQNERNHTLVDKLDYAMRIGIAIASSKLPKAER